MVSLMLYFDGAIEGLTSILVLFLLCFQAIGYMQQDLAVAKSLGDTPGECRAHGNLGSAYFSKGSYKEALTAHRHQLVLAMKCRDLPSAASALTSLGLYFISF